MKVSKFLKINKPRFRHFMALKESASDQLAKMRLLLLRSRVSPAIRAAISQFDMKVARNVRKHR